MKNGVHVRANFAIALFLLCTPNSVEVIILKIMEPPISVKTFTKHFTCLSLLKLHKIIRFVALASL
jgi:hypothetical protein